jgi:AbrB family looped-hinge helix DNA binding protein
MQKVVDKFGRVIIPKETRDHLDLKPGSLLQITVQDNSIVLKSVSQKKTLSRKNGILVFTGKAVGNIV